MWWSRDQAVPETCTWEKWASSSTPFIAPSWSWASSSDQVYFGLSLSRSATTRLSEIIDVSVSTVGKPIAGHLLLKGPSIKLRIDEMENEISSPHTLQATIWTDFRWDHGRPPLDIKFEFVVLVLEVSKSGSRETSHCTL